MSDRPVKIILHKRVEAALDALSPQEKETVAKVFTSLAISGIEHAIQSNSLNKLKIDEPLYLLRINFNLRAILRLDNDEEIQVLDIMTHDRLEIFAAANS